MDPKQVLGGVLTLTMFLLLGRMIKNDHFDSVKVIQTDASGKQTQSNKVAEINVENRIMKLSGPWMKNEPELTPCWSKLESKKQSKGFITFSLTDGPEFHHSQATVFLMVSSDAFFIVSDQIADAVVVARYLGATLVIPDIQGSNPGEKRKFEEIYNVEKFVENLNAVVKVATDPADVTADKPATLRIPNRPTAAFISEQIEPIYRSTRNVKLVSFFPSLNMKIRGLQKTELDQCFCLGMFGTLELQSDIHDVADQMLERLRTVTDNSGGHFIAIDLRLDMLQQKGCEGAHGTKKCFSALEVGKFLQKIGFNSETVIYVTQSRWHEDLDELKTLFPRTYTKARIMGAFEFMHFFNLLESVIPIEKKDEFLNLENSELEKVIDFYICTHSDVFVPAIPGLFYANVAGQRIASGRTQILVPTRNPTSAASDFLSHYISDKSHLAYSCLC
ncbi:Uncharacterized protein EJ110_NYTH24682 [Nymphaea thermarum]|nr:Uncharacterized protein EJ110_NYTH24682 [Nymphaea thermarum]